jgi:hypothetical protein
MTWHWYPDAWNGFADRGFNAALGCSNEACTERQICWARCYALRNGGRCARCKVFEVHDHFERWDGFHAKAGERIAFGLMGDLFDPARPDEAILKHFKHMVAQCLPFVCVPKPRFLLQTRHVGRLTRFLRKLASKQTLDWAELELHEFCEIGTTFSGFADLKNVEALAELPKRVVRFVAFEPCEWVLEHVEDSRVWDAIVKARPNWCYVGFRGGNLIIPLSVSRLVSWHWRLRHRLNNLCKTIWKRNTDFVDLNRDVTLP